MTLFPRWLVLATGWAAAFIVVCIAAWFASKILLAAPVVFYSVFIALLLTALLTPLADRMERAGVPRWAAAALALVLLVVVVAGIVTLVVNRAMSQTADLRSAVDDALAGVQQTLTSPPFSLSQGSVGNLRQRIVDFLGEVSPSPGAGAAMGMQILSGIALVVFLTFFLVKDGPRMTEWARRRVRAGIRPTVDELAARAWHALSGYSVGMIIVATVDAVLIGIGLVILQVPLAISLSLLVFLGAFVPIVGATVSGAVAVAVTAATVGLWQAVVILGVILLAQQLEGNVVQPIVMGRAVRLHPVVIVLAVAAGAVVGGIGGAVIAVPVVAVAYRVLDGLLGPEPVTADGDGGSPGRSERPKSPESGKSR